MKLSLIALVLLTATNAYEKLGGPIVDVSKFPTGSDTSKSGATDQPNDNNQQDPNPAPENNEVEEPEPTPEAPAEPEEKCEEDGRYTGRPTPCDGSRTNHCTIIPKDNGWTYYYYYTYY